MAAAGIIRLTQSGRTRWLTGAVVLAAFLVGCAETRSSESGKETAAAPAPAARTATATDAAAPTEAVTPTPAPTHAPAPQEPAQASATPAALTPASEKFALAADKAAPVAETPAPTQLAAAVTPTPQAPAPVAKPASPAADRPVTFTPPEDGKPMSDADREALAEMIRAAVTAAQKEKAEQAPAAPTAATRPSPVASKKQAAPPSSAPAVMGPNPPAEGEDKKAGCGPTVPSQPVDLTPPPEDQPQPKFAVKEKQITSDGVWQGKAAEFKFAISNEGQAPLAIRLKKG